MDKNKQIIKNTKIGKGTKIWHFVNLYDCMIGDNCIIGTFVEIQKNVVIGNNVKVGSHTFICDGVKIEDNVFIGHGVMFTNDKYPQSVTPAGKLKKSTDWNLLPTVVKKGASIGTNVTILPGLRIGENAIVGAGAVVTKNVAPKTVVVGNPAKVIKKNGV